MDKLTCPSCGSRRPIFVVREDGTCDRCEVRSARAAAAPIEIGWADVRAKRDRLLAASDWTQRGDIAAEIREKWMPYRQALRDLPQSFDSPTAVVWPEPPA